jgi:hypothetical protein
VVPNIKTKQDLIKSLGQKGISFIAEIEVVNDADVRAVAEKMKGLLRQNKKLRVALIERD